MAALVALPSLGAEFLWDDQELIVHNKKLHNASLLELAGQSLFETTDRSPKDPQFYFRPVTKIVHGLCWRLFADQPFGFHLVNVLLHLAVVVLLFFWLHRRFSLRCNCQDSEDSDTRMHVAVFCAVILFATHPSRPQAVSWISGSADLLAALFGLVGLVLWQRRQRARNVALTALALVLALFSKESAIALPMLLLVDVLLLSSNRPERRRDLVRVGCVGAAVAAALVVRGLCINTPWADQLQGGAWALVVRVAISFGFSALAVVWPFNQRFQLNFSVTEQGLSALHLAWYGYVGGAIAVGVLVLVASAWRKERLRPWTADLVGFCVLLSPSLNALSIGSKGGTLSERFLYLPLIAVASLVGRWVLRTTGRGRVVSLAITAALCLTFAVFSIQETGYMQNDEALFEHFLEQDPDELFSVDALLRIRMGQGDRAGARALNLHRAKLLIKLADTTPASGQGANEARVVSLLSYVELELLLTSDRQQPHLNKLRHLLAQLHRASTSPAGSPRPIVFMLDRQRISLRLTPGAIAKLSSAKNWRRLRGNLATLLARTGSLNRAQRLLVQWTRDEPQNPRPLLLLIKVLAWRQRLSQSMALADQCNARFGGPIWSEQRTRVQASAAALAPLPADSVEYKLKWAELVARLGLPAAGYQALARLTSSGVADELLVHSRVRIMIADGRFDLAITTLQAAAVAHPRRQKEFLAAQKEVRLMARSASSARVAQPAP